MRILFYSDADEYGGHEKASAALAGVMHEQHEIIFMAAHEPLRRDLEGVLEVRSAIPAPGRWAGLFAYAPASLKALKREMSALRPDLVCVAQGNIEFGIRALLVARSLKIPVWSYIPMCQSLADQEARWAILREPLARHHYRLFDGFIVIAPLQERYLRSWIAPSIPVGLVENHIAAAQFPPLPPPEVRDQGEWRLACIGRIRFKQKGQDRLIALAQKFLARGEKSFKLIIVGDGPDRAALESMVAAAQLSDYFDFKGWQNDMRSVLGEVDGVISCSHFEGVPLSMVETLLCLRPFFAPDLPEFRDYLSDNFLYASLDEAVDRMQAYRRRSPEAQREQLLLLRSKIVQRHDTPRYRESVMQVLSLVQKSLSAPHFERS